MPTTIVHTIKSSGGDYSSLSAWEAAQQRNLVTADEIAVAECYPFVDTTATTISGWTTGVNNYIIIRAHPSAKATMPMATDGSRYLLQTNVSGVNTLDISQQYTQVYDIQVESTGTGANSNGMKVASNCLVRNCITRIAVSVNTAATYFFQGVGNTRIQNCVGISIVGNGSTNTVVFSHDNAAVQYDNCTAIIAGTNRKGWRVNSTTVNGIVFRNCLSVNLSGTTGNCFGYSGVGVGTSSVDAVKSVNNLSSDSTAFGTNPRLNQTVRFVDSASQNYRLSTLDTAALNFGVNLSTSDTGSFSDTFDGLSRGTLWSIGAAQPNVSTQTIYNAKYGPKIVTNGLVLALDAANTKSYPGSGTNWINLSNTTISGSLISGPTFSGQNGGSIVFDGTNDTATLDRITGVTSFTSSSNYTISCWVYVNTSQDYSTLNYKNILTRRGRAVDEPRAGGGINYNLVYQLASASLGVSTATSTDINFLLAPFETNKWNYVAAVYSWTTSLLTVYVNTQTTSTPLTITGNIAGSEDLDIMRSSGLNNFTAGRLSMIMIHNRALSQQEVLQNFNATRSRFGI